MYSYQRSLNEENTLDWLPQIAVRIAVLDMNNGARNIGVRNIKRIIEQFSHKVRAAHLQVDFEVSHFHVRDRNEVPDASYDIYISSGGPGSPLDDDGAEFELKFFGLLDALIDHNATKENKKFVFGICHSFQMMAKKFAVAEITKRENRYVGVVPIIKTPEGQKDVLFEGLQEKFYAFDNRDWQVINPDYQKMSQLGASILSYESNGHEIGNAVTAIRYTPEIETVQFHPEAEKHGILMRFSDPSEKQHIVELLGEAKFDELIQSVNNPNKLTKTYKTVLPGFLWRSYNQLMRYYEMPQLEKFDDTASQMPLSFSDFHN
ncbi:GMP synthase [bacterium]|nr:GMP synthase [bacterium]